MIPDSEYLELYQLFSDIIAQHPAVDEHRVVLYHPDLFVEMSREILRLRQRITYLQGLELKYQAKADECIKLCDIINQVKAELHLRHIKLQTPLDIRSRR